jgi:ATP-dependent Lhr-like helicase
MTRSKAAIVQTLPWAHPLVNDWFVRTFGTPTEPQSLGWPHILAGRTTLISAPTGSGKTLSAFLACIDRLVRLATAKTLPDITFVVYVSPLKALSNDIQKNLDGPLGEIKALADERGIEMVDIRTAVRTGDTLMPERQAMLRRPPHILVTTPESLYILLTADKSRKMLSEVETVIVDEIHAVADDKRGAHLAITLERLARLTAKPPTRIGLSATQNPISLVADFLAGANAKQSPQIVNIGHRREMDIAVEVPKMPLAPVASQEFSSEQFDRIAELVSTHRSTIVFVNTRKQAERIALNLGSRIGEDVVACHHGSLSRQLRLNAEKRLKNGEVRVLVATASLELGIDIGYVDLVCQVNTVTAISTALQRIGRSGHWRGAIPKGRLFPFTRDELMETAALVRAIKHGDLDKLEIPECPLDILAQQIVAMTAVEELDEEELFEFLRRAYPYRNLTRHQFTSVIEMLSDGISGRRGRYGAYLSRDQVHGKLRSRRGARLAAITSGGAIPESALYSVVAEPEGHPIGTLDEHFAIDSHRGDVVVLGSTSWRIRRIDNVGGKVYVEDAHGEPPSVPFWFGEAPARTDELSRHVSDLRASLDELTKDIGLEFSASYAGTPESRRAVEWLNDECGLSDSGAEQLIEYVVQGRAGLGAVPTINQIVAERFFDEGGGMQLVLHAPFGGRINRAWGFALRKKFCRSFNLELQAAATEDGLCIALSERHSFPLGDVFYFLAGESVKHTLEQASLQSPVFGTRWRWDAMRALALLRFMGGKKVPPYLQRLRSDDLLAAVFPGAAACQDNTPGDVEIPDHPLINEVMKDVLTEAMDLEGLQSVIAKIKSGEIRCIAVDTTTPSQFSAEIINSEVYTYLDDAGIEERRTRAVQMRRVLPQAVREEVGQLDAGAIARVVEQAWPDVQNPDELHDLLLTTVALPEKSEVLHGSPSVLWHQFFAQLQQDGRATRMQWTSGTYWVSAECYSSAKAIWREAIFEAELALRFRHPAKSEIEEDRAAVVLKTVRGWVSILGPFLISDIEQLLGLSQSDVELACAILESEGAILRGQFSGRVKLGTEVTGLASYPLSHYEWCDRRLLSRIHRATLETLRRSIEPVAAGLYVRWLTYWQHVAPDTQMAGEKGLLEVLRQLQGFEIPASAWEKQILKKRVKNYKPELLDRLCLKGAVGWGRLSMHPSLELASSPAPIDETALKSSFLKHVEPVGELLRAASELARSSKKKARGAKPASTGAGASDQASTTSDAPGSGVIKRVLPSVVAPIAFFVREDADWLAALPKLPEHLDLTALSASAQQIELFLRQRGASFFADIARGTELDVRKVEKGLWELVTAGVVSADGFDNLRSLLDDGSSTGRKRPLSRRLRDRGSGRWTLLHAPHTVPKSKGLVAMCNVLLNRYGVVFRDVVQREANLPPWRELLAVFRQMEDRGEVRGGRFISGFIGEQFALPEAVDSLRAYRSHDDDKVRCMISASDPLNLVGTVLPGDKVSPISMREIQLG